MIIAEYNLPGEFSDDVLHAATAEADKFIASEGILALLPSRSYQ